MAAVALAGVWSYRARDTLATAMHGIWGSFWLGYGIYWILVALGTLPPLSASGQAQPGFGCWFSVHAAITWAGMLAALAKKMAFALAALGSGRTILAIGWAWPVASVVQAAGDVLVASVSARRGWRRWQPDRDLVRAELRLTVMPFRRRI